MASRLMHGLLENVYRLGAKKFSRALSKTEKTQRQKLQKILSNLSETKNFKALGLSADFSYEKFASQTPLSDYNSVSSLIDEQRKTGSAIVTSNAKRYEPTSGSTGGRKWIPYSQELLSEFNAAVKPWLFDTYQNHPKIKKGPHYWSLSWLPSELRGLTETDDTEMFPVFQKMLMKNVFVGIKQISYLNNVDDAWFATLTYLVAARDLSLISVWSPTFLLKTCHDIVEKFPEILKVLESGHWKLDLPLPPAARTSDAIPLKNLTAEYNSHFFKKLWPHLSLLSAWDSSTSTLWAKNLKQLFHGIPFEGKGLWTTEGVITIPYGKSFPLAIESHFYEFRCLKSGEILPSWKLEKDQEVQPVITTSGGLIRYQIPDRMKVTGFLQKTPCLEFRNRMMGLDLVGEKIDATHASQILTSISAEFGVNCLTLFGERKMNRARYSILIEAAELKNSEQIKHQAEFLLSSNHHYKLARELGQLEPLEVKITQDFSEFLAKVNKSHIFGQNKVESLYLYED